MRWRRDDVAGGGGGGCEAAGEPVSFWTSSRKFDLSTLNTGGCGWGFGFGLVRFEMGLGFGMGLRFLEEEEGLEIL